MTDKVAMGGQLELSLVESRTAARCFAHHAPLTHDGARHAALDSREEEVQVRSSDKLHANAEGGA